MRRKCAGGSNPEVVLDGRATYREEERDDRCHSNRRCSAHPLGNGNGQSAYDHLPVRQTLGVPS